MPTIESTSENPILQRLQELERETDYEFVLELIEIYLNETPKQIQTINSTLSAQNLPALTIAAHTLKGSSLNLGAKKLGAICLKFEGMGRSGNPILDGTSMAELDHEFEEVKKTLAAYKKR